jgi:hypothetical protein
MALVTLVACAPLLAAACSAGGPGHRATGTTPRPAPTTTTTEAPTTTTTAPEEPGWTTVGTGPGGIAVDERTFPQFDGNQITVERFLAGHVDYSLHVGSEDPPTGNAVIGPNSAPRASDAERPLLLACFNGSFKVAAGVGGFEVASQVLVPLVPGLASLVIDAAGVGEVGVWGSDLPGPGEEVVGVMQNLPPLVVRGVPSPTAGTVGAWGATLGGVANTARSALGQDARGNLLYAASMAAYPLDLANALVSAGAVTAMELDINPQWIHLEAAGTPGGPLSTRVPRQNRPADTCLSGWIRSFVVVLSVG